jgi:hypothetical protein
LLDCRRCRRRRHRRRHCRHHRRHCRRRRHHRHYRRHRRRRRLRRPLGLGFHKSKLNVFDKEKEKDRKTKRKKFISSLMKKYQEVKKHITVFVLHRCRR